MVRVVDDDRILGQATVGQARKRTSYFVIHSLNCIVVVRIVLPHLRDVRVVLGQANLVRTVGCIADVTKSPTFVRGADVDDLEERLVLLEILPVGFSGSPATAVGPADDTTDIKSPSSSLPAR